MTEDTKTRKVTLRCTLTELTDSILEVCTEGFAPEIDINRREAATIAGWLYATFKQEKEDEDGS